MGDESLLHVTVNRLAVTESEAASRCMAGAHSRKVDECGQRYSPARLGVLGRTEKICATENAVSLGQTEGIYLTGKEKGPIALKPFSVEKCHDRGSHGRGFQSRTGGFSQTGRQDYDVRNDQALPNLQAAINQASTNGYRALHLR